MIRLVKRFSEKQFEWRNDPNLWQFVRQSRPITFDRHQAWINDAINDRNGDYWGIEVREESKIKGMIKKPEIVGYCGLDKIHNRGAEYSILIGPEYQGRGYATEGLKLLLEYGFNTLDLIRIWGEIIEGNDAGIKIAMNLGFKVEGLLRSTYYKQGKWKNSTIVSILREEYGNRSPS